MKKIFFILTLFFYSFNIYADDFWLKPKWGTNLKKIKEKYKLELLEVPGLKKNLTYYLKSDQQNLFKQYIVNEKNLFKYGDHYYFVIAGFFKDKLEYVIIATEELSNNKIDEDNLSENFLNLLGLKVKWTLGFSLMSGYSLIGYGFASNNYYELQSPYGKDYIQLTIYICNSSFFKKLKLKSDIKKPERNEFIINRKK